MARALTSIVAFAVALVAGIAPVPVAHAMAVEGSGGWRCNSAWVMGQYLGTDCWYVEPQGGGGGEYGGGGDIYDGGGEGGGGGLGSWIDKISALLGNPVWMDLPPPPLIACSQGPGDIEREAMITAIYKAKIELKYGAMPAAVLSADIEDVGKKWLVWYEHPSGVWVGAVYEKHSTFQAQIQFRETIAPACNP